MARVFELEIKDLLTFASEGSVDEVQKRKTGGGIGTLQS